MILWHLLKTFAVNPFFDLASICLNSFCIGCIFNLYLGRIRLQKEIGNQECCILISKPSKCLSLNIYELLQGVPIENHKNEMPIKQIQSCKYVLSQHGGMFYLLILLLLNEFHMDDPVKQFYYFGPPKTIKNTSN